MKSNKDDNMPTEIDRIKQAEQKAEDIRAIALEKSREDIRNAQEMIVRKQKEEISKARSEARKKLEDIQNQVDSELEAQNVYHKSEYQEYKKKSMVNIDKASNVITKRILDI